jgi:hypothetical protein
LVLRWHGSRRWHFLREKHLHIMRQRQTDLRVICWRRRLLLAVQRQGTHCLHSNLQVLKTGEFRDQGDNV